MRLAAQAEAVVRHMARLQGDEACAIVWDGTTSLELKEACRQAAERIGRSTVVVEYSPIAPWPRREYCKFAGRSLRDPLHLPDGLAGALGKVDVAFLLLSDLEILFSPDIAALRAAGLRGVITPYLDTAGAERLLPTDDRQVASIYDTTRHYVNTLLKHATARVTTPAGTDVTVRYGSWPVRGHDGVPARGSLQVIPSGLVAVAPDDGTANGVVVIDRSIAHHDYKALNEPIRLEVHDGEVTRIDGGKEADSLRTFLENLDDPRAFHLTELGMGTNPACNRAGVNAPTEETHTAGGVSFALGCDSHLGGATSAPVHIDMTMYRATLTVGATVVVDDGHLVKAN
jgi:2,5-dihydroxypyridine 5,6-dioxygenase